MEGRAKIPPGLPRSNPTTSYWQDPPDEIANLRSTQDLPTAARYVIIGSGISGAFIAHEIFQREPKADVIMLEARSACSGATGRNGGHTKGASYRSFLNNVSAIGIDDACRVARLEWANIQATHAFAKEHGIECDSYPCETVDIIYDPPEFAAGKRAIALMKEHVEGGEEYEVFEQQEARNRFLTPNAIGAFKYKAGSISGYRLVVGVLKLSVTKGMNLQTNTPALSLKKPDQSETWTIQTSRGDIETPNVILATNGYTAHLWPALQGVIVPLRGQISAQRPGQGLPSPLHSTYSFMYSYGYEYMISRPAGSKHAGDIIIGGGWANLDCEGKQEFGETDDTVLEPRISEYLARCTAQYYGNNWGEDHPQGRVRTEWTGVMGTSADGLPYVGAVPDTKGLWISASFDGHGMALCIKCAQGLVATIFNDQDSVAPWFPKCFKITKDRLGVVFEGRRNIKPPQVLNNTEARV